MLRTKKQRKIVKNWVMICRGTDGGMVQISHECDEPKVMGKGKDWKLSLQLLFGEM